ncbi:MAG: MFS transporter [Acidimicrobiales bacterium]
MMGVLGIGLGITFAAIPGLIVQAVPARETGSDMGFYQVVRFAGFSVGSALTTTLLAAHVTSNSQPTVNGYTTVLWVAAGICVLAAALAWSLSGRPTLPAPADRLPAEGVRLLEQTEGDVDLSRREAPEPGDPLQRP